jgi:hypothetical protein
MTGTPSDGRRTLKLDVAALVTSFASLVVAVVAVYFSYQAWQRPYPVDPTQVPSYGTPTEPIHITDPVEARRLIAFIDNHAGRKVRIHTIIDGEYFGYINEQNAPSEDQLTVPTEECPTNTKRLAELSPRDCLLDVLQIAEVSKQRQGLYYEHGSWRLNGYFASVGLLNVYQGYQAHSMTPLTAVEAVS